MSNIDDDACDEPCCGASQPNVCISCANNAAEPAVLSLVADLFGDGCNGQTAFFSSQFIEHMPQGYHSFFPMPFRERAVIRLRNDTDRDLMDYTTVDWEPVPELPADLGYFHAAYAAQTAQIHEQTVLNCLSLRGCGHLVGRQVSIETDKPVFKGFLFVMEGNNEVDIDGESRVLDYLDTECSSNFGWGRFYPFVGPRAGAPLNKHDIPAKLSTYRFHQHLPIHFNQSLDWRIDWSHDQHASHRALKGKDLWRPALKRGGCWAHFNSVHYWYQTEPGGYRHEPLLPLEQRMINGRPTGESRI